MYGFLWTPVHKAKQLSARRIITVLFDTEACRCGCGGRCSIQDIWRVIVWSFAALRRGIHPDRGPDQEILSGIWASLAGQRIKGRGHIGHMGADLEAFSDLTGMRRWNHNQCPCVWCDRDLESLHDNTQPHEPMTTAKYAAAKALTQKTVTLTRASSARIQACLAYDDHPKGSKGRALTAAIDGLRVGDRLEIIPGCRDLGTDISKLPVDTQLQFYRPSDSNRLTFWCELFFNVEYGDPVLTQERLVGDLLHTGDGGVCQYAGGSNFEFLLQHAPHAFGIPHSTNQVLVFVSKPKAEMNNKFKQP